jgi:hypothetical protein
MTFFRRRSPNARATLSRLVANWWARSDWVPGRTKLPKAASFLRDAISLSLLEDGFCHSSWHASQGNLLHHIDQGPKTLSEVPDNGIRNLGMPPIEALEIIQRKEIEVGVFSGSGRSRVGPSVKYREFGDTLDRRIRVKNLLPAIWRGPVYFHPPPHQYV